MASPAKKTKRNPNFCIEFAGDNDEKHSVLENLQKIRSELNHMYNQPVGNFQVIEHLFKLWFEKRADDEENEQERPPAPSTYVKVQFKKDAKQKVFLCAEQSLQRLVEVAEHHKGYCKENLKIKKIHQKGHVISEKSSENKSCENSFLWSSYPYLPKRKYLVNTRVNHSFS